MALYEMNNETIFPDIYFPVRKISVPLAYGKENVFCGNLVS